MAGVGFGIALLGAAHAVVQAIQQEYTGLGATIFLVVIVGGPLFGLGLGVMITALIRDDPRRPDQRSQPQPDQGPVPSPLRRAAEPQRCTGRRCYWLGNGPAPAGVVSIGETPTICPGPSRLPLQ